MLTGFVNAFNLSFRNQVSAARYRFYRGDS
ncbi:hypothetical protein VPHD85_0053 [Vibrio phage D85]